MLRTLWALAQQRQRTDGEQVVKVWDTLCVLIQLVLNDATCGLESGEIKSRDRLRRDLELAASGAGGRPEDA